MKCIHFLRVFNAASRTSFGRGIHTGTVFHRRARAVKPPPKKTNYEPGLRHREAAWGSEEATFTQEIEDEEDLEEDVDFSNVDKVFDKNKQDEMKERRKLGWILTAKKFFKGPPQPPMLTCNERECIRYLHKSDPVQWDVRSLSESFPATPETIKKVLKRKLKLDGEQKKKLDLKVKKNWDLLAEGKLKAEPEVLEHLKKFINRREVLLEQIKSSNFYLPEIKQEVVWNNGEMSNILHHYEKAIQEMAEKQHVKNVELLSDYSEKTNKPLGKKSSLEVIHEKVDRFKKFNNLQEEESFVLGEMIKTYSESLTLDKLKKKLLRRADEGKTLHLTEKAIVESALGHSTESNVNNIADSDSSTFKRKKANFQQDSCESNFQVKATYGVNKKKIFLEKDKLEKYKMNDDERKFVLPDNRTRFCTSDELGKVLDSINNKAHSQSLSEKEYENRSEITETEKNNIDFSDPRRSECEKKYYDDQVKDIENTAFWNGGRTNKEKALAENEKAFLGGPDTFARGNVYSNDVYPERIQIPNNKRGSGLTFKVKDCYYDDDGEFLYRVPGMVK